MRHVDPWPPERSPLPATVELLEKTLAHHPVLWVGAGASVAAGYPKTNDLLAAMAKHSEEPLDISQSFPQVVDTFVAAMGRGTLQQILRDLFATPRAPTAMHRAIARLAKVGSFQTIITTNYDPLIERALEDAGVKHFVQTLDGNEAQNDDALRVLKLHGSYDDWAQVILSGKSYDQFAQRYAFLTQQLNVLLRQQWVVFVGCSMLDPRILEWLAGLPAEWSDLLMPWRPFLTKQEWAIAAQQPALQRGSLRAFLLENHAQLPALWTAAADRLAPHPRAELELTITVGTTWRGELPGCPAWTPVDPLASGSKLAADLQELHRLDSVALLTQEDGTLTSEAAAVRGMMLDLAHRVGEQLARTLLSPEAHARLSAAIHAGTAGQPPTLRVRVRPETPKPDTELLADRILALPWELLPIEGRFPVEDGRLDIEREALVDGLMGLQAPTTELSVVAAVSAPIDSTQLDHEDECYRLWQALGARERLIIADTGQLSELLQAVREHKPPVIHFTGHGTPGALLFEDDAAEGALVSVDELVRELRQDGRPLPTLFYLAACHGTNPGEAGATPPGARADRLVEPSAIRPVAPSTAATLHRAGFHQVVAYFGPVGDAQSTRIEAAFYGALAEGLPAGDALRRARVLASKPHQRSDGAHTHVYPLGWAQVVLYHRGAHVPTAQPTRKGAAPLITQHLLLQGPADGRDTTVKRLELGFVGRRKPRSQLIGRWKHGGRAAVVSGLGGLGKTTLCTEVLATLARRQGIEDTPAFIVALDGRAAGKADDPFVALWEQVARCRGDEGWNQALAGLQQDGLTPRALAGAIALLGQLPGGVLVYLDDAESLQKAPEQDALGQWKTPELAEFWRWLLTLIQPGGSVGLLASSRVTPRGTPPDVEVPLEPMRTMDVIRMLSWWPTLSRLLPADQKWLADRIDGHPRTAQYLDFLAGEQEQKLVAPGARLDPASLRAKAVETMLPTARETVEADLLLPKLWEALDGETQELLGRCTVLLAPAPWQAIQALETKPGALHVLARAGLLSPFHAPGKKEAHWQPHGLVSNMVRPRWTKDPKETRRQLGQWFAAQAETAKTYSEDTQAMEYFLAAEDANAAWPHARLLVLGIRHMGRYREALVIVERVLRLHPTGEVLGLAWAFGVQLGVVSGAIPQDAEDRLRDASLLVAEQERGFVLSELGSLLRHRGRLKDAAVVFQQSVAVEIMAKGTDEHSDVAAALHALAGVLHAQGDLVGARARLERSLEIKVKLFGTEEHYSVAASLHELAGVLHAQGDLAGARARLERVLEIKAKAYGTEEHPSVSKSLHSLAAVLRGQGDLAGARSKLERVLEIEGRIYGTRDHYSTAQTEEVLASLLLEMGDTDKAIGLLLHALRTYEQQFGPDHPHTMRIKKMFGL